MLTFKNLVLILILTITSVTYAFEKSSVTIKLKNNTDETLTYERTAIINPGDYTIDPKELLPGSTATIIGTTINSEKERSSLIASIIFKDSKNNEVTFIIRDPLQFRSEQPKFNIHDSENIYKSSITRKEFYKCNPPCPDFLLVKEVDITVDKNK